MALGFEKMYKGSLRTFFPDRVDPTKTFAEKNEEMRGKPPGAAYAPAWFGNAAREHMEKYGSGPEHCAKIAWKNHKHSVNNPYSQFQDLYTLE